MTDRLKELTEHMRRDVLSMRHRRQFADAQQRSARLAQYATPADALTVLKSDTAELADERDPLTHALLLEHRRGASSFWSTMLVVAYYPMLSCLRYRLVSARLTPDDLDQLVLCTFLGTLDELSLPEGPRHIALRLRRSTARTLFRVLRRNDPKEELGEPLESDLWKAIRSDSLELQHETQLVFGDLCRRFRDELEPMALEVIAATVLGGQETQAYIEGIEHGCPHRRRRTYQRLKRKRSRALARMRCALTRDDILFERSV
jgi:hypothetical protein